MDKAFRFAGVIVGLLLIFSGIFMLLYDQPSDNWWVILSKVSSILVGIALILYGIVGRKRFEDCLPGTGRDLLK